MKKMHSTERLVIAGLRTHFRAGIVLNILFKLQPCSAVVVPVDKGQRFLEKGILLLPVQGCLG